MRHTFDEKKKEDMILLRALLNGIIGVFALVIVFAGTDRLFTAVAPSISEPPTAAWVLGSTVAVCVLLVMSNLQRISRQLSIPYLVVQNILSIVFILLCVVPGS